MVFERMFFIVLTLLLLDSTLARQLPTVLCEWYTPPTFNPNAQVTAAGDGPLLGNGDMGVVVGADIATATVTYYIGTNSFWAINNTEECFTPHHWPDIGYDFFFSHIMTLGRVSIHLETSSNPVASFYARQDIFNATVTVELRNASGAAIIQLVSYVAADTNTLITDIVLPYSTTPSFVSVTTSTLAFDTSNTFPTSAGCTNSSGVGTDCTNIISTSYGIQGDYITRLLNFEEQNFFPIEGSLLTRSFAENVKSYNLINVTSDKSLSTSSLLQILPMSSVTILTAAYTNLDAVGMIQNYSAPIPQYPIIHPLPILQKMISNLNFSSLSQIRNTHDIWWRDFWYNRGSSLSLPDDIMMERYWYGSAYLLAIVSREGKVSPGLWGNLIFADTAAWHSDYTINYNHQAPFWGTYSTNRIELSLAHYNPFIQYVPRAITSAANMGAPQQALHYPAHIAPFGLSSTLGPDGDLGMHFLQFFLAQNLILHYEYTLDMNFLKTTLYPYLKLGANWHTFWLKNVTEIDHNNATSYRWIDPNDCTLELCNGYLGGHMSPLNSVMALSIINRCMRSLLAYAKLLNVDRDLWPLWTDIVENISQYPLANVSMSDSNDDPEESLVIWISAEDSTGEGTPPKGGAQLDVFPIFPSELIGMHSDPNLIAIGMNTVYWGGFDQSNSFCWIFPAGARIGYPVEMLTAAWNEVLLREIMTNLWVFEGGGGIETAGAVEGINSMLMQSNEYAVALFPVWNNQHSASFHQLRAKGGFLVSASYNASTQEIDDVHVVSESGSLFRVFDPWQYSVKQRQARGLYIFNRAQNKTGKLLSITMSPSTIEVSQIIHDDLYVPVRITSHSSAPKPFFDIHSEMPERWISFETVVNGEYVIRRMMSPVTVSSQ